MSRHSTGTPDISGYSCNVAEPKRFMAGSCTSITNVAIYRQFQQATAMPISEPTDPSTASNFEKWHKII